MNEEIKRLYAGFDWHAWVLLRLFKPTFSRRNTTSSLFIKQTNTRNKMRNQHKE